MFVNKSTQTKSMKPAKTIARALVPLPTVILAVVNLFAERAAAQIQFSAGSPYSQDFGALANTGTANPWTNNATLPGWYASQTAGSGAVTNYRVDTGSSIAGGLYSFGASGSTNRALGSLATGTPGSLAYGVRFTNDTALAITNLTVSCTGEQWRCAGTNAQTLEFSCLISDAAIADSDADNAQNWTPIADLDFTSPTLRTNAGALDGTAATNQQNFSAVPLPGVVVQPGQEIFFRWYDTNDPGSDHALAIDDLSIAFSTTTPVVRIARWDFNATNSYSASAPGPCIGTGTACLIGVNADFTAGSSADPAGPPGTNNSAWDTRSYSAQGTANKQAGVQFRLSTAGYQGLQISWEQRNSPTASRYLRLQYATDGTNFTDGQVIVMNGTNAFGHCAADLSAVPGVNNNSNFAFRIVGEFESTALGTTNESYVATGAGSTYSTAGTIRFDLVTVTGMPCSVNLPALLSIHLAGSQVVLTWTNAALTLQSAPAASGPFSDVAAAARPFTNSAGGTHMFYRLRP